MYAWCTDEQRRSSPLPSLPHSHRQLGLHGTVCRPVVVSPRQPDAARGRHSSTDVVVGAASSGRAGIGGHSGNGVRFTSAGRHGPFQRLAGCLLDSVLLTYLARDASLLPEPYMVRTNRHAIMS